MQAESIQRLSVIFNEQQVITSQTHLQAFLAEQGWQQGKFVVVVNDQIIAKSVLSTHTLAAGDRIDVLSPISGG